MVFVLYLLTDTRVMEQSSVESAACAMANRTRFLPVRQSTDCYDITLGYANLTTVGVEVAC